MKSREDGKNEDGSDQEEAQDTQTLEMGLGKLSLFAGKESAVHGR
jgi:hypothetical protein